MRDAQLADRHARHRRRRPARRAAPRTARAISARRRNGRPRSRPRNTLSATIELGNERELLVDDADAAPADGQRIAGRRAARRRARRRPASARTAPPRILMRVDLPAPFSPTSACISPACELEVDAVQHAHAAVRFRRARARAVTAADASLRVDGCRRRSRRLARHATSPARCLSADRCRSPSGQSCAGTAPRRP